MYFLILTNLLSFFVIVGRCKDDDDEVDEDDDEDGMDDSDEDREDATEDADDALLDSEGDTNSEISIINFEPGVMGEAESEYETWPEDNDDEDGDDE